MFPPVLVALERPQARTRIAQYLIGRGFACDFAAGSRQIFASAVDQQYAGIVLDCDIQRSSQEFLIAELRASFGNSKLVFHAGRTVEGLESAVDAIRSGADGVVIGLDEHELDRAFSVAGLNSPTPDAAASDVPRRLTPLQQQERALIIDALRRTGGHVCDAARLLRLGQATVYRKIHQYRIPRTSRRRRSAT